MEDFQYSIFGIHDEITNHSGELSKEYNTLKRSLPILFYGYISMPDICDITL
jgi:hypothetical protein